jgi:RNA recognition motif-containing protein
VAWSAAAGGAGQAISAQVFVGNLDYDTMDESALYQLFARHLPIRAARVMRSKQGRRCSGVIDLHHASDIARACELDVRLFQGRRIGVRPGREE